jgi:hypothetical protein
MADESFARNDDGQVHDLKCWPQFYGDVESGAKPFEVRKNDRDYKVGDVLLLREWASCWRGLDWSYTGRQCRRKVTYILKAAPFVPPGYCVMGLAEVERETRSETALRATDGVLIPTLSDDNAMGWRAAWMDLAARYNSLADRSAREPIGTISVHGNYVKDSIGPVSALPDGEYDLIRRADGGSKKP